MPKHKITSSTKKRYPSPDDKTKFYWGEFADTIEGLYYRIQCSDGRKSLWTRYFQGIAELDNARLCTAYWEGVFPHEEIFFIVAGQLVH